MPLHGHSSRDGSGDLSASSSSSLFDIGSLELLVLSSPGGGPSDHMGLGLIPVKLHGFFVDIEVGGRVSGDEDDTSAWVDLVLTEVAVLCSNNHFL